MKLFLIILLCFCPAWTRTYLRRIPNVRPGTRIIGGEPASPGQYPWIAAIYKYTEDGLYFCGGSMLTDEWILTAAQCVIDATRFEIRVGSNQLESEDDNRLILTSSTYFYEPQFNATTLVNDIGLIKTDTRISFNEHIQPVRMLPTGSDHVDQGLVVDAAGWGQISNDGPLTNDLYFVELTIRGQDDCRLIYGDQLSDDMCCAEGNANEGPCFGDIGGPLMTAAPDGDYIIQVAISSFISTNGCENRDPTGYTRTDAYSEWISSVLSNN